MMEEIKQVARWFSFPLSCCAHLLSFPIPIVHTYISPLLFNFLFFCFASLMFHFWNWLLWWCFCFELRFKFVLCSAKETAKERVSEFVENMVGDFKVSLPFQLLPEEWVLLFVWDVLFHLVAASFQVFSKINDGSNCSEQLAAAAARTVALVAVRAAADIAATARNTRVHKNHWNKILSHLFTIINCKLFPYNKQYSIVVV